jgi:hypothetical protein
VGAGTCAPGPASVSAVKVATSPASPAAPTASGDDDEYTERQHAGIAVAHQHVALIGLAGKITKAEHNTD